MDDLKILVIPTTDWTGHPVPNRLNFIFDRLADHHTVNVCEFKMFEEEKRDTECNLVDMSCKSEVDVGSYYLKNFTQYSKKIRDLSAEHDVIVSSNIVPSFTAALQETTVILDYLDHFPQSASSYYKRPLHKIAERTAGLLTSINLKKADGVITPTQRFKEYLVGKTCCDIEVIPNGLDLKKIKPTDPTKIFDEFDLERPVLGYVGSLESWIDLESVIKMMPSIKKRYPKAKLLIVGPDLHTNYSEYLKDLSEEMRVEKDVKFVGRVDYEELSPYITAMDVGLNPRKPRKMNSLTMGSKVLTYLACGVPVLSNNMPEAENRFEGKGVYSYNDDQELLSKLAKCLTKGVKPEVVKEYDWDRLSKKYENAIYKFYQGSKRD